MDEKKRLLHDLTQELFQTISYEISDIIQRAPTFLRPAVVAVIESCVQAEIANMPESARQQYETKLHHIEVITLPHDLDPRKQ